MAAFRFIKPHSDYAYFPGDVVSDKEIADERLKKLEATGHVVPHHTAEASKETPESKTKKPEKR